AQTRSASAVPSISSASLPSAPTGVALASKFHRPCFADENDLDLSRILQLRLDSTRDLLGQGGHAHIIDLFRGHDNANLPPRLDRKHFLDTLIARLDLLQSFPP